MQNDFCSIPQIVNHRFPFLGGLSCVSLKLLEALVPTKLLRLDWPLRLVNPFRSRVTKHVSTEMDVLARREL
jgi:hypothetical protein